MFKNIIYLPIRIVHWCSIHIYICKTIYPNEKMVNAFIHYIKFCRSIPQNPYKLHWIKENTAEDYAHYLSFY